MARLNYQALSMIALTQGEDACRKALSADSVGSPHLIAQKAAVNLSTMGAGVGIISMLNALAVEFAPQSDGQGRGRVALAVGMKRKYKAQAVEGSDSFIRLPVGVLGAFKGDEVEAEVLEDGTIRVTRA
jgi:hypothetical protein